ncbi:xanthine dehydrogenase family protein subunit M [Rhodobacterales bacterium HKCCE2091]|nr:xanthine dehydrogenase family protein subunit M [Rhodobacterales bacterium HKCCE2091]
MRYAAPETVDEAVALLASAEGGAYPLAGGTDLVVQMSSGMRAPALVVDIKRIGDLGRIVSDASGIRIGAAVCGAEITGNAEIASKWPGFAEAMDYIGSMQIQSRATPAGNLCNASPAADCVPGMVAAGATVTVAGPGGRREIPVEEVPAGPGRTTLAPGEFVISVNLPPKPARTGDAYVRFTPRTEMDIAVVGVGVCLTLDEGGTCTAARVAVGAVAPTVLLVREAGAALVGTPVDDAAMDAAAEAVRAACRPIDDKRGSAAYRTRISGTIFKRAAGVALARARA